VNNIAHVTKFIEVFELNNKNEYVLFMLTNREEEFVRLFDDLCKHYFKNQFDYLIIKEYPKKLSKFKDFRIYLQEVYNSIIKNNNNISSIVIFNDEDVISYYFAYKLKRTQGVKVIMIEDGVALYLNRSFSMKKYLFKKLKLHIKELILHQKLYLGSQGGSKVVEEYYCCYPEYLSKKLGNKAVIKKLKFPNYSNQIVINFFSNYFKNFEEDYSDKAIFVSQPLSEDMIITCNEEKQAFIRLMKKLHISKNMINVKLHHRDNLSKYSDYNILNISRHIPFEYVMFFIKPKSIIGFYSTALINLMNEISFNIVLYIPDCLKRNLPIDLINFCMYVCQRNNKLFIQDNELIEIKEEK
jgi:hypothetical protein